MPPATRRRSRTLAAARPRRAARGGFTLVEMLVSVTLVLLMMLMFAEIYGLAQETMTSRKGIAENDQKARILSEVLRRDVSTRSFRSVYPFRFETAAAFAQSDKDRQLLAGRRGYFSISENDVDDDTDDVLQLTISASQMRFGRPGDRLFGRAIGLPTEPTSATVPPEVTLNQPEFDDTVLANFAGASDAAEVSYFLKGGNLFRSTLLIRRPYTGAPNETESTIDPAWTGTNPYLDYAQFSTEWPTDAYPNVAAPANTRRSFWQDFDYSAYRWDDDGAAGSFPYLLKLHGPLSLESDPEKVPLGRYVENGGEALWVPRVLGVPYLRFGHNAFVNGSFPNGLPLEYSGTNFIGRYTAGERSDPAFEYPGSGWAPFDGTAISPSVPARRGVDLMLSNVHSFDVEVWDDVLQRFVDLGHSETAPTNPFTGAKDDPGYYHIQNRRDKTAADHASAPVNFGNRYDTWNPRMYVGDAAGNFTATVGRAPYRPQVDNKDPNADPTYVEAEFGEEDAVVDAITGLDHPAGEVPLRAIRITIRYLDPTSGQTRQTTMDLSLID